MCVCVMETWFWRRGEVVGVDNYPHPYQSQSDLTGILVLSMGRS